MGGDGHVDLDLGGGTDRLPLELGHRLGDHLAVEVVAHCGDVARLALAEEVARAADLEVAHGDPEARPELGGLTDGPQALVGLLGQHPVRRVEEVGVGPHPGATDAPTQLVELPEAEAVGTVDHEGVHRGHVDARLDDGGADEDVVVPFPELHHDLLEAALVHLAVGDGDAGLGHELAEARRAVLDVLHAVVHEEHLALAQELATDGLGHGPLVVLPHVGEDRLAVRRRGVQQRQVADAGERHLEGPGDGRGRQREHVDVGLHLLDRLLGAHAEALLLVDDEQAQVLEGDVAGQEAVGPDDEVHLAGRQPLRHRARLGRGEEPGEQLDPHGVGREAVGEGLEVLGGEERGRHQQGHLLAVLDGLEGGPQRHLGLAEADVAADQAVHRGLGLHVRLDLLDGAELVGGLLVRERLLQLGLPGRVLPEGVAAGVHPLLVEHHELLGDLLDRGTHPGLGLLPVAAAHPAEARRVTARVRPDGVDLVRGHVELVVAAVLEEQVVALHPADGPLDHAAEAGDAVLVVHDVVAGVEVLEEPGALALAGAGAAVGASAPGELVLGEHGEPHRGQQEAALEGGDHDAGAGRSDDGVVGIGHLQADPVVAQELQDAARRAGALGGDHHAVPLSEHVAELGHEGLGVADRRRPAGGHDGGDVWALRHVGHRPRGRVAAGEQTVERHVQRVERVDAGVPGLRERPSEVRLLGEDLARPVPEAAGLDQHDQGIGPDPVEHHGAGVVAGVVALPVTDQPGHPRLHAVEDEPLGEPLPVLAPPRFLGHELRRPGPQRLALLPVETQLAAGVDDDLGPRPGGALVGHGELAQAVDLVAPQVDADRGVGGGREDVDDRPPDGELAAVLHLVLTAVAERGQTGHEVVEVDGVPLPHHDRFVLPRPGREPLDERTGGRHHDPRRAGGVAELPEDLAPAGHHLDAGAHPLERQGLPGGEQGHRLGTEVDGEVTGQALGVGPGGHADHQRSTAGGGGQRRQGHGPGGLGDGEDGIAPTEDGGDRRVLGEQTGKGTEAHGQAPL